jgi:hypothetical protein
VYNNSPLDPLMRKIESKLHKAIKTSQKEAEKELKIRNNSRATEKKYKTGDKLYLRLPIRTKYDDFWEGPFLIKSISNNGNTFRLRNLFKEIQANLKQLKPAFQKEEKDDVPIELVV